MYFDNYNINIIFNVTDSFLPFQFYCCLQKVKFAILRSPQYIWEDVNYDKVRSLLIVHKEPLGLRGCSHTVVGETRFRVIVLKFHPCDELSCSCGYLFNFIRLGCEDL